MAGHSHFANIRRTKDKNDAKKAKLYTMLSREIRVAAVDGPNPEDNSKLRNAIAKAKSMGLPKDNIERAIKSFDKSGEIFETVIYEAYYNNIAIIIVSQTNNRARTGPEVKSVVTKAGANIGEIGSALFLFENLGMIFINKNKVKSSSQDIEEYAFLECNACDFVNIDNELIGLYFEMPDFNAGSEKLTNFLNKNCSSEDFIEESCIGYNAQAKMPISDQEKLENFHKLIEKLESLDDVINVFHNCEL